MRASIEESLEIAAFKDELAKALVNKGQLRDAALVSMSAERSRREAISCRDFLTNDTPIDLSSPEDARRFARAHWNNQQHQADEKMKRIMKIAAVACGTAFLVGMMVAAVEVHADDSLVSFKATDGTNEKIIDVISVPSDFMYLGFNGGLVQAKFLEENVCSSIVVLSDEKKYLYRICANGSASRLSETPN